MRVTAGAWRPRMAQRWLWFVTGTDSLVLSDPGCPDSERRKFTSIGLAMCITTGLAFISGLMAFYQIFFPGLHEFDIVGTPWRAAFSMVFAALWTLIILNMQRFLMFGICSGIDRGHLGFRELAHALPGVAFSVAIALPVATPLQVLVFEPEIDAYLTRETHAAKTRMGSNIDASYRAEWLALLERHIRLESRLGRALSTQSVMYTPPCASPVAASPSYDDRFHANMALERCIQMVSERHGGVDRRLAEWSYSHPGGTPLSPEDERALLVLQTEWLHLRMLRERLLSEAVLEQGAGLLKRTATAYEVNPIFAWVLFLVVCFIQAIPVLIRAMSPRGAYDDFVDINNRRCLAHAGIEPTALHVFDRHNKAYSVDRYLTVNSLEEKTLAVLREQRQALRRERLARFAQGYAEVGPSAGE